MRRCRILVPPVLLLAGGAVLLALASASRAATAELAEELKGVPFQIVFETRRDGNWELYQVNADGSRPVNLTKTPSVQELYPHVSPDGKQICFVVDEGEGDAKCRNVYVMNRDGSGRRRVLANGRDPCWHPSGAAVLCLKGEFDQFTLRDYASRGVVLCDLASPEPRPHPNPELHHLYNICSTPDGTWYVATVHAGMGFSHAILAIEAQGRRVFNLKIPGCRPDISPDGKRIAWGPDDFTLRIGDLDFTGPEPKVTNQRDVVKSEKPMEVYHVDWSPDGRHVAFSRGPKQKKLGPAPEMIGVEAPGWDLCVADATTTNLWVALTTDGKSNKEPDWAPAAKGAP